MPTTRGLALTPLLVCSHSLQDGNTPLHLAGRQAVLDAVRLLIAFKADALIKNKVREAWWWGRGACAVDFGHWLVLRLRAKGVIGGRMQGCDVVSRSWLRC